MQNLPGWQACRSVEAPYNTLGPSRRGRWRRNLLTASVAMENLSESAVRKREAWARRPGTETYVKEMGAYALRRDDSVVRRMLGPGPGRLLDLPCGTGRFFEVEKDLGFQVTGADYSPTMLAVAEKHSGIELVKADVFNPPFPPAVFDVILTLRLLFHYENPERILSSLLPSLKPGGRMIFDTLNAFSLRWAASKVLDPLRGDPARKLYFERPSVMAEKIRGLGLDVIERESAYIFPTRLYRYFPRPLWAVSDAVEAVTPSGLRVLTYWNVRRPG